MMDEVGPNFFLIGAPKCATTSLYGYLARHPEVFCPSVKEPGYFTREGIRPEFSKNIEHVQSYDSYLNLYKAAPSTAKILCDGSTSYLRSAKALEDIAEKVPKAFVLACVRDPVELISSYYEFLRYEGWEDSESLEEAWAHQDSRRDWVNCSEAARRPDSLYYANVAMLGEQIIHAKKLFGSRLIVLTPSEIKADFANISKNLQVFLGIKPLDLGELPRLNPARRARFDWINKLLKKPPFLVVLIRDFLKKILGRPSLGLRKSIDDVNNIKVDRHISDDLRAEMRAYFYDDVLKLGAALDRDFLLEWGWTKSDKL